MSIELLISAIVALGIGFAVGYYLMRRVKDAESKRTKTTVEDIISKAEREKDEILKESRLEAKDIIFKGRQELEREVREKKKELSHIERRLEAKDETLDRKLDSLSKKEDMLSAQSADFERRVAEVEALRAKTEELKSSLIQEVEKISLMTCAEAKQILMDKMIEEAKADANRQVREIEQRAEDEANKRSRSIIATAIQHCAGEATELASSTVALPNDALKGPIIGREGRNIKAFQMATGVDIIIDDTPEVVYLSCYDPYRREMARITLERMIAEGRIQPARIEELFDKASKEMDKHILEIGQETVFKLGLHNIHKEILRLIGRLKYRTSYGQNVLDHSVEVATIAGNMASELGMDPKIAKRCGLLHDIGKAIDSEQEGSHTQIGVDIAKRHREDWRVINAIASHHFEEDFKCIEAVLVQAADALSAGRPGARYENMENYFKRLEDLEKIVSSFDGVAKSFAIQAGKEVRVMVDSDKVNDARVVELSRDISKRIESELTYPGQVKVTVIRETRSVGVAK